MSAVEKAQTLRSVLRLLSDAAETIIQEWEAEECSPAHQRKSPRLPSSELFQARRVFIGACGLGMNLVQDPITRLTEVSASFFTSRALRVAVETRIAEILSGAGPGGISIHEISQRVGIQAQSLARVLRTLSTLHIFDEVKENYYANSIVSQHLIGNEPLRCWLLLHSMEVYTASDKLPNVLYGSLDAGSPPKSSFQEAYGISTDFWEWLDEPIAQSDGSLRQRPEREIWTNGMWRFGLEHVQAPAVCDDYPWEALSSSTVVDVGAGIGGMSFELAKRYPDIRFIVEDRPSILPQAEGFWQSELPLALANERVRFIPHNFFSEQPVKGADVYVLRHILHDWADEECITILKYLRDAMGPSSLLLIADNVMQTTASSEHLKAAPPPLPANYGHAHVFANLHDLLMFTMFNGGERTAGEFAALAARAGLRLTKVWECRGLTSIVEMRLHG